MPKVGVLIFLKSGIAVKNQMKLVTVVYELAYKKSIFHSEMII